MFGKLHFEEKGETFSLHCAKRSSNNVKFSHNEFFIFFFFLFFFFLVFFFTFFFFVCVFVLVFVTYRFVYSFLCFITIMTPNLTITETEFLNESVAALPIIISFFFYVVIFLDRMTSMAQTLVRSLQQWRRDFKFLARSETQVSLLCFFILWNAIILVRLKLIF